MNLCNDDSKMNGKESRIKIAKEEISKKEIKSDKSKKMSLDIVIDDRQ